jgi:hypothetical protein
MSVISSITVENIQDHNRWTVVLFTSKSSSANGPACNAAARDARSNFKICFALHDKYFRHIAALNPPAMLHRNKVQSSKGGHMFVIAVVFLLGVLTLSILSTIEG